MKKRILFVTNHFRFANGVASVLRSLIANLDTNKYDISLLAIYDFNEEFAKPIIDKITVVKGFGFYKRGFDKLVNLIPSKILYKMFIKEHYDLEIAFQFGIPTKMIALSDNPHKLCWMHTYDAKMKLKKFYKKFPMIINVAKAGREKLIAEGFDADKCEYCYNIIDEVSISELFNESCEFRKSKKICFATVARLAPDKAFMRYLECIKAIVSISDDFEFLIVGGGCDEEKMRGYIKDNHLEEYIIMVGKQSNPYRYLKEVDVYFCCSYREGFSTACQEAAILGIPVVSTNVDGAQELLDLTNSGMVVDNSNEGIMSAFFKIIENPELINTWKSNSLINKYAFYKEERFKKIDSIIETM